MIRKNLTSRKCYECGAEYTDGCLACNKNAIREIGHKKLQDMRCKNAVISKCGQYRYTLRREFDDFFFSKTKLAVFVMLNPSTADAKEDDATIRRCIGFAKREGYMGLMVVNLYALRSTDPKSLWLHEDPVGPENNTYLERLAMDGCDFICGWGGNAKKDRVKDFTNIVQNNGGKLYCLDTNNDGSPKHPLYIKADQPLMNWNI